MLDKFGCMCVLPKKAQAREKMTVQKTKSYQK